jgi:outer membrane biosynthesis protein TonB
MASPAKKKVPAKKSSPKKAPAKKVAAPKPAVKKAPAKKAPVAPKKKVAAPKPAVKKAPAKKVISEKVESTSNSQPVDEATSSIFMTLLAIFIVAFVVLGGYLYARQMQHNEAPAYDTADITTPIN